MKWTKLVEKKLRWVINHDWYGRIEADSFEELMQKLREAGQ